MEKIDTDVLYKGNEQFTDQKLVLIAQKVNEIIDLIESKKDQLL